MDSQNSVSYVILGAVLALATSFFIEIWKEYRKERNLRNNFKIVFKLELKSLLIIIDKLTEGYGNHIYFPYATIDQFDRNLQRLENYRKDTIYLKEESRKEELLTCVNDLLVLASDIRGNENFAFRDGTKDTPPETEDGKKIRITRCEQQRQIYSLRTVDLKRRIQDIINYLNQK